MVISGERKLLDVTDIASDMDRLRKMFSLFEKKTDLLQLLDVSSRAQGVQHLHRRRPQLMPVEEISIITAPYGVDGKGGGHAGRDRPHPHGLRAGHSHRRHHDARLLSNALSQNQ